MYPFTSWKLPEWAGPGLLYKQLIRYLLKKTLGSFVKSDFALDTLEFEILKGQLSLKKLDLNVESINELLSAVPLRVLSGNIENIYVAVPWQSLLSEPSQISIDDLHLEFEIDKKPLNPQELHASFLETSTLSIANDFLSELQDSIKNDSDSQNEKPELSSEIETPQAVGGLIDKMLKSLKISVTNLNVTLRPKDKKEPGLLLRIGKLNCSEDNLSQTTASGGHDLMSRSIAFSDLTVKLNSSKNRDEVILRTLEENTIKVSYKSNISNQGIGSTQIIYSPSLRVEALFQAFEVNLTPSYFIFLSNLIRTTKEAFSFEPNQNSSQSNTVTFKPANFRLHFSLKQICLKIFYLTSNNHSYLDSKHSSHLKFNIEDTQLTLKYHSDVHNMFHNLPGAKEGELQADLRISKVSIDEWLSSYQFPTSIIPSGAYSFSRDGYNPILSSERNLPNNPSFLKKLNFIGEKGNNIHTLGEQKFSGLSTFWSKNKCSLENPEAHDLKLLLSSDLCTIFSVDLETLPLCLRFDPRLIDRLKPYLSFLAQFNDNAKQSEPSTAAQENNDFRKENLFSSDADPIFDECQIMHDLDTREDLRATNLPMNWKLKSQTNFLRVIIQGPCDILGDSTELNHQFARVHQDFWVMDVEQPWAAFPGPPPCLGDHAKIGYKGLDITLLGGINRTAHGFLSVFPSSDYSISPTLEIGRGSGIPFLTSPVRIYNDRGFPVPFPPIFEGFSEGEVKATDLSEREEEILGFKQNTVETSLFTINCNFPRVELHFTKKTYDQTQFLLNDITSWEPKFTKDDAPATSLAELERPSSPTESEGGASFYTAYEADNTHYSSRRAPPSIFSLDTNPTNFSNSPLPSLSSLVVSMPWLCIHLDMADGVDLEKNCYSINFSECSFFSTSKLHGKTQAYTHSEAEEFYILEMKKSSKPQVIVSPIPSKFPESNCFSLNIFTSMEPPMSSIKDIAVALSMSNLDFHIPLSSEPPPFIKDLSSFFSGDSEVVTVSNTILRTSVTLSFYDFSFILDSQELDPDASWITILIRKAEASTTLFGPNLVTNICSGIEEAQILLSQRQPNLIPLLPKEMRLNSGTNKQENMSASQFWKSLQFSQIGTLKCLGCDASFHNRRVNPLFLVDITNDSFTIELCRDSLSTMKKLMELLTQSLKSAVDIEISSEKPGKEMGVLEEPISYNILDTLDEDAYGFVDNPIQRVVPEGPDIEFVDEFFADNPADPELDPPPSLTYTPIPRSKKKTTKKSYDNYITIANNDFISDPNEDLEGEVKVLEPVSSEIIEDYFVRELGNSGRNRETIDSRFDFVKVRLHVSEFDLTVKLYDGTDWSVELTDSPQSSPQISPALCNLSYCVKLNRPPTPSMELVVENIEIDYFMYYNGKLIKAGSQEEDSIHLMVTVKDIEVLDYIPTSTWRKFLAHLKPTSEQLPRESQSKMIQIDLSQLRPTAGDATLEYRLKVSVLPLRLFVDQDALNFLIDFFINDPEQDPLSSPTDIDTSNPSSTGDEIYFQYVEVGSINVMMDYKPKHLNLQQLREGNYAELAKVFHLEDSHITLDCVKLNGVNGLAKLTDDLIGNWLPHITGTQIPSVVSGVGPIRSLANIGSGVADLVLLPLQQYKKDGRIVRGVARGASSFARATTSEAVRVGTSLVMGAQIILEQADSFFKGPSSSTKAQTSNFEDSNDTDTGSGIVSKYAHQPSNLNEGMEFAYRSLRRNIDTAARTVLAVPVEFSEQSGIQGSTRAVIRAIPIAVLHPMIGATQAMSMALLGLRNSLDPFRLERLQDKYKTKKT